MADRSIAAAALFCFTQCTHLPTDTCLPHPSLSLYSSVMFLGNAWFFWLWSSKLPFLLILWVHCSVLVNHQACSIFVSTPKGSFSALGLPTDKENCSGLPRHLLTPKSLHQCSIIMCIAYTWMGQVYKLYCSPKARSHSCVYPRTAVSADWESSKNAS